MPSLTNEIYNEYSAQVCKCTIQYFMGGVRTYDYFANEVSDYKIPIEIHGGQGAYQKTCYDMFFRRWGAVHEQCYEGWAVTTNDQCFEGGKTARYDVDIYDEKEIKINYYFSGLEKYGGKVHKIMGVHHLFFGIPILNCLIGPKCPIQFPRFPWYEYVDEIRNKYVGQNHPGDKIILKNGIDEKCKWRPWYGFIKDYDTWGWTLFSGVLPSIACMPGGVLARQGGQLVMMVRVFLMGKDTGIGWWETKELRKFYTENKEDLPPTTAHQLTLNSPMEEKIHTTGTAHFQTGVITKTNKTEYREATKAEADSIIEAGVTRIFKPSGTDQTTEEIIFNAPNTYNKCKNRPDSDKAAWIRVDIPELLPFESGKVLFTYYEGAMDFGIGPGMLIENKITTYHMWRMIPDPNGQAKIFFQKKYIEKIIMAPYFVYVKDPRTNTGTIAHRVELFRCKLGEVLKLDPGIYYFPNPCYCLRSQKDMGFFAVGYMDPDNRVAAKTDPKYEIENKDEFLKTFPSDLPMYCNPSESDGKIKESLFKFLGYPWATEGRDERGGVINVPGSKTINMEYAPEIDQYTTLSSLIQGALSDL